MKVIWCKCRLQSNCRLNLLNLKNDHFDDLTGVYIIFYGNDKQNIVCVGSGNIRDKLDEMKSDKNIQAYSQDLYVTWAYVPAMQQKGVEAYLFNELNPKVFNTPAKFDVIPVNLP